MDHLEAAALIAHDRGVEYGGIALHPKDATGVFTLPNGDIERFSYPELIAEGERLKARVPPPRPRSVSYSFEFSSPLPGGRR